MNTDVHGDLHTTRYSAADIAYRELKSAILAGEIPLGVRLGEERIAERLSVSRTPVREALLRLYAEQFLERHPDGGFRVNYPTGRAIGELYEVRRALELFAVRRTVEEPPAGAHERLAALHDEWATLLAEPPDTDPEFVLVDEDFHCRLADASGNRELVEALRRVGERIRTVRTHDFVTPGRIAATIAQHLEVLGAVLDGQERAEALLEEHILESQRLVEAAVGVVLERMLTGGSGELRW